MGGALHVGMLVTCVRGGADRADAVETFPVAGRVYTIRSIGSGRSLGAVRGDLIGVLLEEIVNPVLSYLHADGSIICGEMHFVSDRFRLIDESRLAVFRRHLVPIVIRVRSDA